jgi:diguanylate cyclase (GGDEF)-like protein
VVDERLSPELMRFVIERINVGIFVLDRDLRVVLWNRFLAAHSGRAPAEVIGRGLFDCFPELPRAWLERKIRGVFLLKNFAFTSWQQRPYVLKLPHHRPVAGGVDFMQQDCTFLPLRGPDGEADFVCVVVNDATDTCISQRRLAEALARLEEQSERDGLTGVYNRRKLERRLAVEFQRVERYGGALSYLIFDLDHFKRVNDTYGHLAGDEVIRHAARTAVGVLRATDFVGRYGGEEFVALLPGVAIDGARVAAERLREAVARAPVAFEGDAIAATVSIGAAEYRPGLDRPEVLMRRADIALYASKAAGRNRVTCWHETAEAAAPTGPERAPSAAAPAPPPAPPSGD